MKGKEEQASDDTTPAGPTPEGVEPEGRHVLVKTPARRGVVARVGGLVLLLFGLLVGAGVLIEPGTPGLWGDPFAPGVLAVAGVGALLVFLTLADVFRTVLNPVATLARTISSREGIPPALLPPVRTDDVGVIAQTLRALFRQKEEQTRLFDRQARSAARREALLNAVFERARDGVIYITPDGILRRVNPVAAGLLTSAEGEREAGRLLSSFLSPGSRDTWTAFLSAPRPPEGEGAGPGRVDLCIETPDGALHPLSLWRLEEEESGDPLGFLGLMPLDPVSGADAHDKERRDTRFQMALRAVRCGVWDHDLTKDTFWWSPDFLSMIGYDPGSLAASPETKYGLIHPEDVDMVRVATARYLKRETGDFALEYRLRHRDGSWMWVEDYGTAVWDAEGRALHFTGAMTDCTARKRFEKQLMHMATHDSLTELPNRTLLQDRLEHALASRIRSGLIVSALLIDIDRFQLINDSLGHDIGDQLLRGVAKRLQQSIRPTDTLAHLAADEFVVVCEDLPTAQEAARIAKRLISALRHPFLVDGNQLNISLSVGIGVCDGSRDGAGLPISAQDLLREADIAMHSAKAAGGGGYRFFVPEMNKVAVQRLSLERNLVDALEHQQFRLHYQPKVDIASGRIVSAEALIRWPHLTRGNVPPDQFIPIAEETGLILGIGEWVLREALSQIGAWRDRGCEVLPIAVNLSAKQLMAGGVDELIFRLLREYDIPPRLLEVEITESSVMSRMDKVLGPLSRLRDAGVGIALDDFGTGYSSLAWLRQLPLTWLKIDRSFVRDTPHKQEANAIAAIILEIGRQLGLKVVAEGVETQEQNEFLRQHRCDVGQGWLFHKAMSAAAFEKLLPRRG